MPASVLPRTTAFPDGHRSRGQAERGDRDCRWMEEVKEDEEGEPAESGPNHTPAAPQPQQTFWSQTLRTLRFWKGWCSFVLVGAVWAVCQVEAPLHPSLSLVDVCWRLPLVCVLWMVLGSCVHALRYRLQPGQNQAEPLLRIQEEAETRNNQGSWTSRTRVPDQEVPLGLVLSDSLLLCVLQEPLPDPGVPHVKALFSRLESVSLSLGKAHTVSEMEEDSMADSVLVDKVKLIRAYLQQRLKSLHSLIRVQGDFEGSVKDMLQGLDGLWAQLEELHTGVTLTKEGTHRDLASALTEAETLFAVLGRHRKRLQHCQAYLRESTQLLQELTWSHTHMSNSVGSGGESVWPELLLQSNIEQFDKVQESFLSLEQQTSTFQAHLQGLGKGSQDGHAGSLAHAEGVRSVSPQSSPRPHGGHMQDVSQEHPNCPSLDVETGRGAPLSLCERSALQFSSTISRLRKSGRRK